MFCQGDETMLLHLPANSSMLNVTLFATRLQCSAANKDEQANNHALPPSLSPGAILIVQSTTRGSQTRHER